MNLKINLRQIEQSFERIANELMNEYAIKVRETYYRIVDCEFYFTHELHNDVYTHGHEEQSKTGSWYFHGSGIDITIGNKETGSKGGILLRGIAKISDKQNANGDCIEVNKKTIGPLNVLTTLFSHFENIFDKDNSFYLVRKQEIGILNFIETRILKLPRIGLNIQRNKEDYFEKLYRFISFPYLPHAEKGKAEKYLIDNKTLTHSEAKELFTLKYNPV